MAQTVACPGCGKTYQVGDNIIGKKVRCKECGLEFVASSGGTQPSGVPEQAAMGKPAQGKKQEGKPCRKRTLRKDV